MLCVSCEWSKRKKFYGSLSGNQNDFHIVVLKQLKFFILLSKNEHEWLWLLKSLPLFRNLLSLPMSINKEKEKEMKRNHNILYVHAILSKIYPSINSKPYLSGSKIIVFTIYILICPLITVYYKIPKARMQITQPMNS